MNDVDIKSLREWLSSWEDRPNWSDETGQTIPISKSTLIELINSIEKARTTLREIRTSLLNDRSALGALRRSQIIVMADDALYE